MSDNGSTRSVLSTPANIVTLVRIAFVPVFVVVLACPWPALFPPDLAAPLFAWQPWIAVAVFALLSATDAVDGHLARSRGEVTNFGKFVDPLADKILVAAALLCLVEMQALPAWIALVILAREFIISGLRMLAAAEGVVIAASWYGKAKTVTQIIAVALFMVKDSAFVLACPPAVVSAFNILAWAVMIVALVLTIVSLVDYFIKCLPVLGLREPQALADALVEESSALGYEVVPSDQAEAAARVIAAAQEAGVTLSTAESCTGGLISGALTSVPGSSSAVLGGVVSYSNEVKHEVLGVSQDDLDRHGAVSSPVAAQMAKGSRSTLGSDAAVSVTGVAGPGGGSPEKPVGTVWFGVSSTRGERTEVQHFPGDRDRVRHATVLYALSLLEEEVAALQAGQ